MDQLTILRHSMTSSDSMDAFVEPKEGSCEAAPAVRAKHVRSEMVPWASHKGTQFAMTMMEAPPFKVHCLASLNVKVLGEVIPEVDDLNLLCTLSAAGPYSMCELELIQAVAGYCRRPTKPRVRDARGIEAHS